MNSLDIFIQKEKDKLFWFNSPLSINATNLIKTLPLKNELATEQVFKETILFKILIIPFLILVGFFCYVFASLAYKFKFPFVLFPLLMLFGCLLIGFITIKEVYFDNSAIKLIKINKDFIQINKAFFDWQDIEETYIMNLGSGRRFRSYLIIHEKSNAVHKIDINSFSISINQLIASIEHYKYLSA